jgi:hypothetical protein
VNGVLHAWTVAVRARLDRDAQPEEVRHLEADARIAERRLRELRSLDTATRYLVTNEWQQRPGT